MRKPPVYNVLMGVALGVCAVAAAFGLAFCGIVGQWPKSKTLPLSEKDASA